MGEVVEICKSRGALARYMDGLGAQLKCRVSEAFSAAKENLVFVAKKAQEVSCFLMPSAILPNLICTLVSEYAGGYFAEKATICALDTTFKATEVYLSTIFPLVLALALEEAISRARIPARPVFAIGGALFIATTHKTDELFQAIIGLIYRVAPVCGNIGGGYVALKLVGSSIHIKDYTKGMIRHNLTGQAFRAATVCSDWAILEISRSAFCALLQTIAYNPAPFGSMIKLIARRESGSVGAICATLSQYLSAKIGQVRIKSILNSALESVTPFFLHAGRSSSFSIAGAIATQLEPKLKALQDNSLYLANTIARTLIQYQSLIDDPIVILKTEELLKACLERNEAKIEDNKEGLMRLLESSFSANASYSSKIVELAGARFVWTEENLLSLSEQITHLVEQMPLEILGMPIYRSTHIRFVKIITHLHLKYYIKLLLSELMSKTHMQNLNPVEELQLFEVAFSLFKVVLFPVLPSFLTKKVISRAEGVIFREYVEVEESFF
jgi:hypothetical protein